VVTNAANIYKFFTVIFFHKAQKKTTDNCRLVSNYQINAQFFYSITICMLQYNPRHVLNSTMLIFRRTNFIITTSDIVTLCKWPYSTPVESRLSLLSAGVLYGRLQRVTISDAVIIQFALLKMSSKHVEDCNVTYILL